MSADIIVSYDGTLNDDDALVLGAALAGEHAKLALAYVRHYHEFDPLREELAQHDALRRLRTGQELLSDPELATHVLFSASTNDGLEQLAASDGARVIAFGSDYRTSPGRAEPGNTAQRLIDGGKVAIAVARAGLRMRIGEPIRRIALSTSASDDSARATASSLSAKLGAQIVPAEDGADLLVVSSQPGSTPGRIALSGAARAELNAARTSVLVLPSATALRW